MKILIDMNLSPDWVAAFAAADVKAIHWSAIGDPKAEDAEIVRYARANGYVIFTHDLDFGTILALTHATGPSVIQVRTQDVFPSNLAKTVISVLTKNEAALGSGALITIDVARSRIRILPLEQKS